MAPRPNITADRELRAWTDQFDNWRVIRSELASAVYDAVYAAGMSFPFPQREMRLLRDPEPEASASDPAKEGMVPPLKSN